MSNRYGKAPSRLKVAIDRTHRETGSVCTNCENSFWALDDANNIISQCTITKGGTNIIECEMHKERVVRPKHYDQDVQKRHIERATRILIDDHIRADITHISHACRNVLKVGHNGACESFESVLLLGSTTSSMKNYEGIARKFGWEISEDGLNFVSTKEHWSPTVKFPETFGSLNNGIAKRSDWAEICNAFNLSWTGLNEVRTYIVTKDLANVLRYLDERVSDYVPGLIVWSYCGPAKTVDENEVLERAAHHMLLTGHDAVIRVIEYDFLYIPDEIDDDVFEQEEKSTDDEENLTPRTGDFFGGTSSVTTVPTTPLMDGPNILTSVSSDRTTGSPNEASLLKSQKDNDQP